MDTMNSSEINREGVTQPGTTNVNALSQGVVVHLGNT